VANRALIAKILRKKAVLLDLDNTLYSYRPCHRAGLANARACFCESVRTVSQRAFEISYERAREAVKKHTKRQAASHSRLLYFQEMLRRERPFTAPQEVINMEQAYWQAYLKAMKLRPWVMPLLKQLHKARIRTAIVTNMTLEWQLKKIDRLGIAPWIDCVVSSEEAGVEKPDPRIFRLALQKLGCKAGDAVGLGDDPASDRSTVVKFYRI